MEIPGRPGHVHRQRARVREVHRDRVGHLRAEREGDGRRRRRDQGIEALRPERIEVALDERPDLLRLEVVGVVVAGRQGVGPEHDPALDLGTEALAARGEVAGQDVAVRPEARPEADPVVAGQVGRRLGRRDDVVRREPVFGVRQADLLDGRAGGLERGHRLADARLDAGLHARDEVLARAGPSRLPRSAAGRLVVRGRQVRAGRPGPAAATTSSRAGRDRRPRGAAPPRRGLSRANGPIWSSELANATIPYRLTRP